MLVYFAHSMHVHVYSRPKLDCAFVAGEWLVSARP